MRVPAFFLDHLERCVPECTCPEVWSGAASVTDCLLADAAHYAHPWGPDEVAGLRRAARALLRKYGHLARSERLRAEIARILGT